MRLDLLSRIREHQDLTNVLVLTHNVDFVFIQNLVLAALRPCGSPSLTVFADAGCARECYALQGALLDTIGRRYRVVPVQQGPGSRFHPKAVFLSGRKGGTLLVGSGNVTFGGWRENAEIWLEYDAVTDLGEVAAFREVVTALAARLPLNDGIRAEVLEAFDPSTRDWAKSEAQASGLLARFGDGVSLLTRMAAEWGSARVDRLVVSTPYFDPGGDALLELAAASNAARVEVLIDPRNSNLTKQAAKRWTNVKLRAVTVARANDDKERLGFVHAKFFAIERQDDVLLFLGSANCSRAALLATGLAGNSELLAVRRLTREQFQRDVLDTLSEEPCPPVLLDTPQPPPTTDDTVRPFILAASQEEGLLRIAFHGEWVVEAAVVDGNTEPVRSLDGGVCECRAPVGARRVRLVGLLDGHRHETPDHWIDHERDLASTAYRRSLHAVLRAKAHGGLIDFGDWEEIARLFCADLDYSKARRGITPPPPPPPPPVRHFRAEELFASASTLHMTEQAEGAVPGLQTSLQAILRRWFSDITTEEASPTPVGEGADEEPEEENDDNGGDRPKPVRLKVEPPRPPRVPSPQERKRLSAIVRHMSSLMCRPDYLRIRHPADLGRDLKLASLVLMMARERGWQSREEVLHATFDIWSALFLSAGEGQSHGWLEARGGAEAESFETHLHTPSVAAALFAWSLEIPDVATTPAEARLRLALALAVTRCPAIWVRQDVAAIADELDRILKATKGHFDGNEIRARWNSLALLARALERFERTVAKSSVLELVDANPQKQVRAGDLVWQGPLGYCVVTEAADRSERLNASVLPLHSQGAKATRVRANYLNPVAGLLGVDSIRQPLGDELAAVLREFIRSVESGTAIGTPAKGK
jgi:hypothetical protein